MPEPSATLTDEEARRVSLFAQGLCGPRPAGGPAAMVRRLGAVQLDTISVLARSHELVAYARYGAIARKSIEQAYWGPRSETFEYWSHAACVLPLEDWPFYAFKRRASQAKGRRWHLLEDMAKSCGQVRQRLERDGPLTARELGGAKRGGIWWDWSEIKIAAEWLLDIGELVCRERRGFQRVYDLSSRAIPAGLADQEPSDEACAIELVGHAGRAMGVATVGDLAAYHGLPQALVRQVLSDTDLVPMAVEGWAQPGWAAPGALDVLNRRVRGRSVLLSPFDSLLWFRPRAERLFGIRHRLEAYVPREKRLYGYFAMPVLAGTKFVGLVDPGRRGRTLVAKQVTLQTGDAPRHVAAALGEAAAWVGCDDIAIERVEPAGRTAELKELVAELVS
ncbi:MAG TPA: crosslink repair DNA glycosylase YcaQ family protein [Acidimicrobiales bacterium]|jgi:hypothetical protein|nr:crosslink repair DNA glycosylase YcaQ family protein [Acidimicrobiales bacterium]